jgi:glycosyltransferase involved in cell wall biosynthesis
MDRYLCSVVIPSYNRAHVVGEAIESVLTQGIDSVQVIVVDDGSTDGTREAVARFGSRVQYVRQENQGAGAARNTGLDLAEGTFIAFLDSDDVWLPGKLATELDLLARFPQAGAVISDSAFFRGGKLEAASRFKHHGVELPPDVDPLFVSGLDPSWIAQSLFSTCCLTFRRSVLPRLGRPPFDPSLRTHEDWEMELRLYHCCEVLVHRGVLAHVRRFDDGTRTARGSRRHFYEVQYRILARLKGLPPLSEAITKRTWDRRRELARKLAAAGSGLDRLRCAALAAEELRDGSLANAARVLALGARPKRTPL